MTRAPWPRRSSRPRPLWPSVPGRLALLALVWGLQMGSAPIAAAAEAVASPPPPAPGAWESCRASSAGSTSTAPDTSTQPEEAAAPSDGVSDPRTSPEPGAAPPQTPAAAHGTEVPAHAHADGAGSRGGAGYEDRVVAWGLGLHGLVPEPSPEGKRVEAVRISTQDIVGEDDPYPQWFNVFHVKTRDEVVLREVLLSPGAVWSTALAEETERNVLGLGIFSIVRVVAAKGSTPDSVVVVVVTKDIWSIRFGTEYNLVGSLLQYLRIQPSEANLLGRGKRLSLELQLNLSAFAVGQSYVDRRLFGSYFSFSESASLVFNRASGKSEGSLGTVSFSRPLRTLESKWGGSVSGTWSVQPVRYYRGADPEVVEAPDGSLLPFAYEQRVISAGAGVTRSYGRGFKTNVTGGLSGYTREYSPPEGLALSEENRAVYEQVVLPRSEDAVYLSARVHGYTPEYRVFRNLATFALSERAQLGPSLVAELSHAPGLFNTARFAQGLASARWAWAFGDSLSRVTATASSRYWTRAQDAAGGTRWVDRRFAVELFEATPMLGPGRIAFRSIFELKRFELDPVPLRLGGGNGLRGVQPEALRGQRRVLVNLEYRTRPIELSTLHVGGVLFYDAGSAFDEAPDFAHTLGLGLRLLFPQFDVEPLRIDFGYALRGPRAVGLDGVSSAFGQATEYNRGYVADPHN